MGRIDVNLISSLYETVRLGKWFRAVYCFSLPKGKEAEPLNRFRKVPVAVFKAEAVKIGNLQQMRTVCEP